MLSKITKYKILSWVRSVFQTSVLFSRRERNPHGLVSVCPQGCCSRGYGRKECTLVINVVSEWGSGWILSFLVFVASFLMF